VQRIKFDESFWKDMLLKLKSFYITSVLPKLAQKFK